MATLDFLFLNILMRVNTVLQDQFVDKLFISLLCFFALYLLQIVLSVTFLDFPIFWIRFLITHIGNLPNLLFYAFLVGLHEALGVPGLLARVSGQVFLFLI